MKFKIKKEEIKGCQPDENNGEGRHLPEPVSTKRLAVNLLIRIAVIAAAVGVVLTFVLGITINYGNHMHPAVNDGDLVVSFRLQAPYLNAAVLYRHDGKTRTGRVVGLSGDVIDISENGELTIRAPENDYVRGRAFILNDYRDNKDDSRSFGTVGLNDIDGPFLLIIRRRGF